MEKEPEFKPKEGQTDYTNIRWCPVINCVLQYQNKILIVQRSNSMRLYPGYWNGIAGFLDDHKNLNEKVLEELKEEVGITGEEIISIQPGEVFDNDAPEYGKTWIVHPVLVNIKSDRVSSNWEAQQYKWVSLDEIKNFKLLPGFDNVIERLSKYII